MILGDRSSFYACAFFLISVFTYSCAGSQIKKLTGRAQGTTYQISYFSSHKIEQEKIDSIFERIDLSLSTYLPQSTISRLNNNDTTARVDDHFAAVFDKSMQVSRLTGGFFDPTVAPLVDAYGFGAGGGISPDSINIDSILAFVGFNRVSLTGNKLLKEDARIRVDFNAIAQGYTVDVISDYLSSRGVSNYLIELGGEVMARGSKNGKPWTIGIDRPSEEQLDTRPLHGIMRISNRAVATSGNYRKFYEENGVRYSHIIDPKTGRPSRNNILSATVIAQECAIADAFATAFMVMGLDRSLKFLKQHEHLGLDVYFIYDDNGGWKTYASNNVRKWLSEP